MIAHAPCYNGRMATRLYVQIGGRERSIEIEERERRLDVRVDGESRRVELSDVGDGKTYALRLGERIWEIMAAPVEGGWTLLADGRPYAAVVRDERERRLEAARRGGAPGVSRGGGRTEVRA